MIEFEDQMAALSAGLSAMGKTFTRQVLDRELRHRFGDRTQLPEEFAARALKAVKASPESGAAK